MSGAFQIGAIGLEAQQRALEIIAGNIANVNTPAYRRSQVRFSELLASGADPATLGADLGASLLSTSGAEARAELLIDGSGRIESTGRAMDLAINGNGFIELMGADGQTLLWRGGSLRIGDDGMLASADGMPLKAAISVPDDARELSIGSDGVVRARLGQDEQPSEIGRITLVRIDDARALERLNGGLYRLADGARAVDADPGEDGAGLLVQGSIERSSVELTDEMVQLMMVQRAYAANAQVVQAADQLMSIANGLRR